MNKSSCLVHQIDSMSFGRRRGCCRACARWLAWPLCASHIEASHEMVAPSNSIRRAQVRWGRRTSASSLLSMDVPLLSLGFLAIFCCLLSFQWSTSPSLVHDLSSFSLNLAWPICWDQWEEEEKEEEERQEVAFWRPLSNFPLCSCWLTGLSNQVFSSGPLLLLPLWILSLSEQWLTVLDEWRRA